MSNSTLKVVFFCFLIIVSCNLFGASLPSTPYGNGQFEGFPEGVPFNPLLGDVDPTAPPMNLGDPCPCPGCTGILILDPYDGDGLTCDNPSCPCQYYVSSEWQEGMFLGFPFPLNNEFITLLVLSLLYATWLSVKKRLLRTNQS